MGQTSSTRFRKRRIAEINVVPYIDVMLVLLIIFMVTAPLLTEGVQVELPQTFAKTMAKDQEEPVVVSVDAKGLYYINIGDNIDKPLSVENLITRVAAIMRHRPGQGIYIKGDKSVNYGAVVSIMAQLQQAGVAKVGLITETPDS
jgi:biopolymer transport protein TolR